MNVSQINALLSTGDIDREDVWPRLVDYESKPHPFVFEFGLTRLPTEPGLIIVRGPRQYGKSTWLDLELRRSIQNFGKGSAYYLNGDELLSADLLYENLLRLEATFQKSASVRRIFIDEITAIKDWEKAIKRAFDEGHLRKTLVVTTGSKAFDLRRGSERLPGRKGKLSTTEYVFLPISYRQFFRDCGKELGSKTWIAYLLAGGAPLALNEIWQTEKIPEYFTNLIRDWVLGDIVSSGRSRIACQQILHLLYKFGGTPVGFAKIAREAGLANNTVASGYIEMLSDLLCVFPQWNWDASHKNLVLRKPCKFPFVNMAAAMAFHPNHPKHISEFENLDPPEQGILLEWLVAQELWRRSILENKTATENLGFWSSDQHEIDFVVDGETFVEVKRGKADAREFAWFPKIFPHKNLTVICQNSFETDHTRGMNIHDFLYEGPSRLSKDPKNSTIQKELT